MSNFPTISTPSLSLPEGWEDPALKSESEGGYEITRPRHTRIRGEWSLKWNAMTRADYSTLLTFFKTTAYGGSVSFSWTCPNDNTSYTVRFKGDIKAVPVKSGSIAGSPVTYGPSHYAVEITLKQV